MEERKVAATVLAWALLASAMIPAFFSPGYCVFTVLQFRLEPLILLDDSMN